MQGNGKGFPDLEIVGGEVIHRELKSSKGTSSAEQKTWEERLDRAGANFRVWRPEHLRSGEIFSELQALRRSMRRVPSPAFRTR